MRRIDFMGEGTRLVLHMTFANDATMRTAVERYGVLRGGVETFERIAGYVEEGVVGGGGHQLLIGGVLRREG